MSHSALSFGLRSNKYLNPDGRTCFRPTAIAPSAVIELFQLELNAAQHGVNETYYFHAGVNATNSGDIIWNGQAYLAFPIEATEFEYTGTGSLPRPNCASATSTAPSLALSSRCLMAWKAPR
jgi:lambda family phage minor tail protein L